MPLNAALPATSSNLDASLSNFTGTHGGSGMLSVIGRFLRRLQRRPARDSWHEARLALGKRMLAAGIDDGVLGAEIGELEQRIQTMRAMRGSTAALETTRTNLLLRLADLALEDDAPLPGAETEYHRALQVRAELTGQQNRQVNRVQPAELAPC